MLALAAVVAVPAGLLRLACVGDICREAAPKASGAPFCSLPGPLREAVSAGYRKGRSPEVLGVTRRETGPWPSLDPMPRVSLEMSGSGLRSGDLPSDASLDDLAPTLAAAMGIERPHPEVRSGEAWVHLLGGPAPRLVIQVVWAGAPGPGDFLEGVSSLGGAAGELSAGSVPLDEAAMMATIGSGGTPSQHGITGALIRDRQGRLVRAWGRRSPGSVIAMLADDMSMLSDGAARIGLVTGSPDHQGLIGRDWYVSGNSPDLEIVPDASPEKLARRAEVLLDSGYGADDVTDLLAVSMSGPQRALESATTRLMNAAKKTAPGRVLYSLVALPERASSTLLATDVAAEIERDIDAPVIEATGAGGFFTDQAVLAEEHIGEDVILSAMSRVRAPDGERLFADRFTGVAIRFERYC
jgi:hypothetical protein